MFSTGSTLGSRMNGFLNFLRRRIIERPAFLLHTSELVNHFLPIWEAWSNIGFDILLDGDVELPKALLERGWDLRIRSVEEVLNTKDRYAVLVSNHPIRIPKEGRPDRKAMIKRLSQTNLRMMYAAGKSGWNMAYWNRLYGGVMCFGPCHAKEFSKRFGLPTVEIGYPRFDRYFNAVNDREELCSRTVHDSRRNSLRFWA